MNMRMGALALPVIICAGFCLNTAIANLQKQSAKPKSALLPGTGSYRPPTWPAFIRLPRDFKSAARLAEWIANFSAQKPGTSIAIALTDPPSAADVTRLLPSGTTYAGNRIKLADSATITLIQVTAEDTNEKVFRKGFISLTVTREQLVTVLQDLPAKATILLEQSNRRRIIVTGDIPRAIRLVRSAPPGTVVSAKWDKRYVRYPRLK